MFIIAAFFVLEIFLGKGKIMKKIWTKALAYVLAVTMCFSVVNVPVYAQGSTVTEETTTDGNDGSTWDQVTTENVFEGENYKR